MCAKFMSMVGFASALVGVQPVPSTELPGDEVVVFEIHQVPSDPQTAVAFRIRLDLTAIDRIDNAVAWEVVSAEFRQPGANGGSDRVWRQDLPLLNTPDGLWWVEHADPFAPTRAEFAMPPQLFGTALNDDPAGADLDFDFFGTQLAGTAPYETTAFLAYTLATDDPGEDDPPPSGDDDPVDIPDHPRDPTL